jgi:hypothetical protein
VREARPASGGYGPAGPGATRADILAVMDDQCREIRQRLDTQRVRTARLQQQLDAQGGKWWNCTSRSPTSRAAQTAYELMQQIMRRDAGGYRDKPSPRGRARYSVESGRAEPGLPVAAEGGTSASLAAVKGGRRRWPRVSPRSVSDRSACARIAHSSGKACLRRFFDGLDERHQIERSAHNSRTPWPEPATLSTCATLALVMTNCVTAPRPDVLEQFASSPRTAARRRKRSRGADAGACTPPTRSLRPESDA